MAATAAAPESSRPLRVLDRYGFELAAEIAPRRTEPEQLKRVRLENARSLKWQGMISDWHTFAQGARRKTLKRRVRKGIPDGVRGHVWQVASGSMQLQRASAGRYGALLHKATPMDPQIEKDLHRTMPQHSQFVSGADGQRQLFRVCHALAVLEPTVGYNQAEAYVAAVLLTYMTGTPAACLSLPALRCIGVSGAVSAVTLQWTAEAPTGCSSLTAPRSPRAPCATGNPSVCPVAPAASPCHPPGLRAPAPPVVPRVVRVRR
jgi:hypothetical protein